MPIFQLYPHYQKPSSALICSTPVLQIFPIRQRIICLAAFSPYLKTRMEYCLTLWRSCYPVPLGRLSPWCPKYSRVSYTPPTLALPRHNYPTKFYGLFLFFCEGYFLSRFRLVYSLIDFPAATIDTLSLLSHASLPLYSLASCSLS